MNTQNQKHGTTCKYCEGHSVHLKSLETELILQPKLPSVHPDFAAVSCLTDTAVLILCQQVTKFIRLDNCYLLLRGLEFQDVCGKILGVAGRFTII